MRTTTLFILLILFSFQIITAQSNTAELVRSMNANIEGSYNPFNFYEKTGSLEQTQDGIMQRFKLDEIGTIKVSKNTEGYSVDIGCREQNGCITLIKNTTNTNQMNVASFFFGNEMNGNAFATHLSKLIQQYNKTGQSFSLTLSNQVQQISIAEPIKNEANVNETKTIVDKKEETIIPAPKTITKKEIVKNEVEEEDDDEKPIVKTKTKTKKEIIEKEESEEKSTSKATKDLCTQINQLLKLANDKNFKSIEGNETNAAKKINDSQFKLKGARKNYLNQYQNQRAFIAELKSSAYYDDLMVDFDNLQSEIEECLGANWDSNDFSTSKEYDNFNGDIRDVEYSDLDKKIAATIRIILLSDENNKSTLFIRIQ